MLQTLGECGKFDAFQLAPWSLPSSPPPETRRARVSRANFLDTAKDRTSAIPSMELTIKPYCWGSAAPSERHMCWWKCVGKVSGRRGGFRVWERFYDGRKGLGAGSDATAYLTCYLRLTFGQNDLPDGLLSDSTTYPAAYLGPRPRGARTRERAVSPGSEPMPRRSF